MKSVEKIVEPYKTRLENMNYLEYKNSEKVHCPDLYLFMKWAYLDKKDEKFKQLHQEIHKLEALLFNNALIY